MCIKESIPQARDCLSLEQPPLAAGPWLASRNLADKQFPTMIENFSVRVAHCACTVHANKQFMLTICFPSGSPGFWKL